MSMERTESVTCPKCGKVSDFIIWESLNADIDPEAQQQLIDGSIFHFTCPECGHKSNVNYRMLYHDMTNRVMVHYVQEEAIDATINTIHEVEGKMNDIDKRLRDGYRTRIVTNQNSLREKALIFKCGLDDRVIELGKLFLIAHAGQQHPDAEFSAVFFNESEGNYYFEFIGAQYMQAEFPKSFYDKIAEELSDRFPEENTFIVDLAWAKSVLGI